MCLVRKEKHANKATPADAPKGCAVICGVSGFVEN